MCKRLVGVLLAASLALAGCIPPQVAIEEKRAQQAERELSKEEVAKTCRRVADVLRDLGSARAQRYYEKAKALAPDDAWMDFAHGEYLRQYRGPGQPLLPKAANPYFDALRKLDAAQAGGKYDNEGGRDLKTDHDRLRERIGWALTDLYQRDGVPVLYDSPYIIWPKTGADATLAFFSSQVRFGREELPVRDLVSGAQLTADALGRDLTKRELRSLVRSKPTVDWTNRLRIRPWNWPWIDIWWSDIDAKDSHANRWLPGDFFDYHEHLVGIAAERTFDLYPWVDLSLRGGYKHSKRTIDITGEPEYVEDYNTGFVGMVTSRVFPGLCGPNKLALDLYYECSHIDPEDTPGYHRAASIGSASLRYSIYPARTRERFTPRSTDFEIGGVRYTQKYDDVRVHQHDWFGTVTVREAFHKDLDLSLGYTTYDERKEYSTPEHYHQQGRIRFCPLWRLVDNENAAGASARNSPVRFVHLLAPVDYTLRQRGPVDFENYGYGVRVESKIAHPRLLRTSFLVSADLTRRDYFRLDKAETLFTVSVRMGF